MNKINNTYYFILAVLGLTFLICSWFIIIFIFKNQFVINISDSDSEKSILFDTIASLVGIISSVFICLTFWQQLIQKKTDKADKDYDRFMKLIDDIDLYEKRIEWIKKYRTNGKVENEIGTQAIVTFVVNIDSLTSQDFYINHFEFYRSFFIYIKNISFIVYKITSLEEHHQDYYESLHTKLLLNIPNLYPLLRELIKHENEITENRTYNQGIILYEQIVSTKGLLQIIIGQE